METKQIEVCTANIFSVGCEDNDSVDIRAGGPAVLGYDFGVSPDEDITEIKQFLEATIRKNHQPFRSISVSKQPNFPVGSLWTKDAMERCIKKGYQ